MDLHDYPLSVTFRRQQDLALKQENMLNLWWVSQVTSY